MPEPQPFSSFLTSRRDITWASPKSGHIQPANREILSGLRQLGFTDYEARIYVQLLKASPATAYEVAKAASVPRANTYAALEALAQRGAVLPVNEEPLRYIAAPPKTLFEGISRQTRTLCSDLSDRLSTVAPEASDNHVWTVFGDAAVQDRIELMIAESHHSIWIKAADEVIRRHKESLRKAAKRGVALMIVLFGAEPEEFRFTKACRVYVHESDGTRMGTADRSLHHLSRPSENADGEYGGRSHGRLHELPAHRDDGAIADPARSLHGRNLQEIWPADRQGVRPLSARHPHVVLHAEPDQFVQGENGTEIGAGLSRPRRKPPLDVADDRQRLCHFRNFVEHRHADGGRLVSIIALLLVERG